MVVDGARLRRGGGARRRARGAGRRRREPVQHQLRRVARVAAVLPVLKEAEVDQTGACHLDAKGDQPVPVALLEDVTLSGNGAAVLAVSRSGDVVYTTGPLLGTGFEEAKLAGSRVRAPSTSTTQIRQAPVGVVPFRWQRVGMSM